MKIIDILNKKANGTLEDGFKFCYKDRVYTYNKAIDSIDQGNTENTLGGRYVLENCLNDEVLLFQKETSITEEEKKAIKELTDMKDRKHYMFQDEFCKMAEIILNLIERLQANKLTKEAEVK